MPIDSNENYAPIEKESSQINQNDLNEVEIKENIDPVNDQTDQNTLTEEVPNETTNSTSQIKEEITIIKPSLKPKETDEDLRAASELKPRNFACLLEPSTPRRYFKQRNFQSIKPQRFEPKSFISNDILLIP